MSARDFLAAATPRPWRCDDQINIYGASHDLIAQGEWTDRPDRDSANAALIAAAVNEYEALLDIAEAVDAYVQDNTFASHAAVANALHRLDAVRGDA